MKWDDCRRINQFKNNGKLGEGTFGVVYRAQDNTGRNFAIKKLKLNKKNDFSFVQNREIAALYKTNHKNIVRLKVIILLQFIIKVIELHILKYFQLFILPLLLLRFWKFSEKRSVSIDRAI